MKQRLDAFERARHRMQAAGTDAAAGQRNVERLLRELRFEFFALDGFAARNQRGLELYFCGIEFDAHCRAFSRGNTSERFLQFGQRAGLAEIACLDLLEFNRIVDTGELGKCLLNDVVELFHCASQSRKKRRLGSASFLPAVRLRRRGWPWLSRQTSRTPACPSRRCRRGPCDRPRSPPCAGRS